MIQKYKDWEPEIHESCFVAPGSAVIGRVSLAENVSVWHNAVLRGDIDRISVGQNSNIQDGSVLHCISGQAVLVGERVTVGHGAILHSCTIGNGSLIGMGAIVLDGAVIGENCLVAAGSVVTPNTIIPDKMMVVGSPAKIKRELSDEEVANLSQGIGQYIELSRTYKEMA